MGAPRGTSGSYEQRSPEIATDTSTLSRARISQCKTWDSQLSDEKFRSAGQSRPYGVASTPLKNGIDPWQQQEQRTKRRGDASRAGRRRWKGAELAMEPRRPGVRPFR